MKDRSDDPSQPLANALTTELHLALWLARPSSVVESVRGMMGFRLVLYVGPFGLFHVPNDAPQLV